MKTLIDIGHPAQVHQFRNAIKILKANGHEIFVTARNNEVTLDLLDRFGMKYVEVGRYKRNNISKAVEMFRIDCNLYKLATRFNPDVLIGGVGNVYVAHVSALINKPSILFNDTEHGTLQNLLSYPFASAICTPSCYKKDIGKKQIRYNGYHELAYLHPNYFTPNPAVLDEIGLSKNDNIFLVRFAAFRASHDTKSEKFKKEYVLPLIKKLETEGEIIISSEIKLDKYLTKYQYKLSPEKYHDVLYYSKMYIGEGSSSAEEAAILGVPSLHFERLNIAGRACGITSFIGVLDELQNKYGLLYSYYNENELLVKVDEVLSDIDIIKEKCKKKREELLKDKIDVTAFMVWFIENYPESFKDMKENPEIQYRFRLTSKDGV